MEVTTFYSAKGGAGCTTVAIAYALTREAGERVLLIDQSPQGDMDGALGLSPSVNGERRTVSGDVAMWRSTGTDYTAGFDTYGIEGVYDHVVIDCGNHRPDSAAVRTVLVTRPCYLHLRAAVGGNAPAGIVVVREAGRALGDSDVRYAVGAPILAIVDIDPAVARAIDAGLLAARLPRSLATPITAMEVASVSPSPI